MGRPKVLSLCVCVCVCVSCVCVCVSVCVCVCVCVSCVCVSCVCVSCVCMCVSRVPPQVNPKELEGGKKRAHDKEARIASILAGREGREKFGSSKGRKKDKTGGLSEKQKQRNKAMPIAARIAQLKNRSERNRGKRNKKNFKGHHRG